jgi:hypothetical protein
MGTKKIREFFDYADRAVTGTQWYPLQRSRRRNSGHGSRSGTAAAINEMYLSDPLCTLAGPTTKDLSTTFKTRNYSPNHDYSSSGSSEQVVKL